MSDWVRCQCPFCPCDTRAYMCGNWPVELTDGLAVLCDTCRLECLP